MGTDRPPFTGHQLWQLWLTPIICFGESLSERESGETETKVSAQLEGALAGVPGSDVAGLVIAYEPIWAIGTGRTASTEQAQAVHAFVRKRVTEWYDLNTSNAVRIQYGGSVKPGNVAGLMSQADIDGALVGGASLTAESFGTLVVNGSS